MAKKPSPLEYVETVTKRSFASWHGTAGWFTLAAYISVALLGLMATGLLETILDDVVNKSLIWAAILWLVALFVFVTPFQMWREEKYRFNLVIEAGQSGVIKVAWNYDARKHRAEIVITNTTKKTVEGYELKYRNYKNADGSKIWPALVSLPSVEGKQPPISLNPLDRQFFDFAELKYSGGEGTIAVLPDTDKEMWLGKECGVELSSTGKDIGGSKIELRLKIENDEISIESWDADKKAVSLDDTGLV